MEEYQEEATIVRLVRQRWKHNMGKIKALKGLGKAFLESNKKKSNWKTVWQPVREVDEKTGKPKGPHLLMKVQTKKGKD